MLRRATRCAVLALAVGSTTPALAATGSRGRAAERARPALPFAVATHFAAYPEWRDAISSVLGRARISCAGTIAISAGRPEWTYFRWEGHQDAWSTAQRRSDEDLLDAAARAFRAAGFEVAAIVDLEAPRYVERHPEAAAVTDDGQRSSQRVSIAALTRGAYRDGLLAMVKDVAARPAVDIVELTELGHLLTSFGPADLQAFRERSGAADWPRDAKGAIDVDSPRVWAWKTAALTGLVRDVASVVHRYGKLLFVDVPVSWRGIERDGRDSGLEYRAVLRAADAIVVWDYFGLEDVAPGDTERLARHLAASLPAHAYYLSLGMWAKHGRITPDALAEATRAALRGGARRLWLTPNDLVAREHWRAFLRALGVDPPAGR